MREISWGTQGTCTCSRSLTCGIGNDHGVNDMHTEAEKKGKPPDEPLNAQAPHTTSALLPVVLLLNLQTYIIVPLGPASFT